MSAREPCTIVREASHVVGLLWLVHHAGVDWSTGLAAVRGELVGEPLDRLLEAAAVALRSQGRRSRPAGRS
jgi:hypothetical protein